MLLSLVYVREPSICFFPPKANNDYTSQAAGGIGRGVAASFAEIGVSGLLCADIDEAGAVETANYCKTVALKGDCKIVSIGVDCTNAQSVQCMVDYAKAELGRIDYFINSAGVQTCPVHRWPGTSDADQDISLGGRGR